MKHRKRPLVQALAFAAQVADQPPLAGATLAVLVGGLALRRPRLARAGMRMLATELLATGIKAMIKHHVVRTRPGKMLRDGRYVLKPDRNGDKDQGPWNSFPSGHTAGAVGVARALAREYPGSATAGAGAAGAVALVQVPSGAHFPSDILAGAAVGLVAEAIVDAGARRLSRVLAPAKMTGPEDHGCRTTEGFAAQNKGAEGTADGPSLVSSGLSPKRP